tara:strand:- start:12173 stop:12565 length:393 start_codon:yes stop_codon:yes gene_type:complete
MEEKGNKLLFEKETYTIIGACMTVHSEMGSGFLESVYHEALEKEFKEQQIPFESQKKLNLFYKGSQLKKYFKADFVCYNQILVELKSATFMHKLNDAQLINYLKATNFKVGLLINFGESSLQWKRFVNTY